MQRYKEQNQERPDWYAGTREEFLRSSFGRPVSVERVAQLTSRVYSDLKGVTDAMSTVMQRTLMDGMIQGKSPRDVAKDLNKSVDGIGITRARTIARTETIRAHADGQLDALKQLGVEEVGVMVEWSTAGDDLVCPLCADLNGIVMKINEAYAIIPRHPNCRCSWIPANVGEPTKDQVRGKSSIEQSIEQSLKKEHPKADSAEEARKLSRWAGADKKIGVRRPVPKVAPEGAAVPKPKPKPAPKPKSITKPEPTPKLEPRPKPEPQVKPSTAPPLSSLPIDQRIAGNKELEALRQNLISRSSGIRADIKSIEKQEADLWKQHHELMRKAAYHESRGEIELALKLELQVDEISAKIDALRRSIEEGKAPDIRDIREMLYVDKDQRLKVNDKLATKSIKTYDGKSTIRFNDPEVGQTEASKFISGITNKDQLPDGKLDITVHKLEVGDRSYCLGPAYPNDIYMGSEVSAKTYAHEMAHQIEHSIKGATKASIEFRDYRIAKAGTKDENLAKLFPNRRYSADEIGNKDDWGKLFESGSSSPYYVGKKYRHDSTEVVSMGVELLYEDPVGFATKDPEYFKFIVGLLRGSL
jgi:SPP1 gp7 family putative phage head morphogenesis protein